MKFHATTIDGVLRISLDKHEDARGFFARSYCKEEFSAHGINENLTQINISYNTEAGTLRGMHYQSQAAPESKIVRCMKGAIYDVAVDLRPQSSTFKQWYGIRLDDENRDSLYIAPGIAHGFITLTAGSELLYLMCGNYVSSAACGVRWNDPAFSIAWPAQPKVISDRDGNYPDFVS